MKRSLVATGVPHRPVPMPGSTDDVQRLAAAHAIDRLGHMLETAVMLSLAARLPALRALRANDVAAGAAVLQDRTARGGDAQAAHILPCQLRLGGELPWDLDLPEPLRLALAARFCVTSALPRPYNAADSQAEASGLCDVFARGVATGLSARASGPAARIADALLPRLAGPLVVGARGAFTAAAMLKRAREQSGRGAAADERLVEALILEAYARGVPEPTALIARVDWHRHAGREHPWDDWLSPASD